MENREFHELYPVMLERKGMYGCVQAVFMVSQQFVWLCVISEGEGELKTALFTERLGFSDIKSKKLNNQSLFTDSDVL